MTCQLPNLDGEAVQADSYNSLYLTGSVRATRATPRLGNVTMNSDASGHEPVYNTSVPFICVAPSDINQEIIVGNFTTDQWQTTICQLGEQPESLSVAGGLISEFKSDLTLPRPDDPPELFTSTLYGTANLIVNITKGTPMAWKALAEASSSGSGVRPPNTAPVASG